MKRPLLGSALFFALAPGVVAGLVPWLLTRWEADDIPLAVRLLGGALIAAGVPVLVHAFARFVTEGRGTPAPVARTEHLVSAAPTAGSATRCTSRSGR